MPTAPSIRSDLILKRVLCTKRNIKNVKNIRIIFIEIHFGLKSSKIEAKVSEKALKLRIMEELLMKTDAKVCLQINNKLIEIKIFIFMLFFH